MNFTAQVARFMIIVISRLRTSSNYINNGRNITRRILYSKLSNPVNTKPKFETWVLCISLCSDYVSRTPLLEQSSNP